MSEFNDTIYTVTSDGDRMASYTNLDAALADIEIKHRQHDSGSFNWGVLDIVTSPVCD